MGTYKLFKEKALTLDASFSWNSSFLNLTLFYVLRITWFPKTSFGRLKEQKTQVIFQLNNWVYFSSYLHPKTFLLKRGWSIVSWHFITESTKITNWYILMMDSKYGLKIGGTIYNSKSINKTGYDLKADSRVGWPNNFLNVLELFSP